MASIYTRPGSPFWYASYRDNTGRRRALSTKIKIKGIDRNDTADRKREAGKAAEVLFDQKQLAQAAAVAPTPAAHSILTSLTAGEDIASGRIFKKELLWVLQYPVRLPCLRTFPQHLPGTNTL